MRLAVTALVAIVALSGFLSRAVAEEEDPALQEIAVAYYVGKYRLSTAEAKRRIAIQDRAAGIDDDITQLLGGDFAGIWYDPSDGGRLKIGLTSAASTRYREVMALVNARGLTADTRTVEVRYSLADLERKQSAIRDDLLAMIRGGQAQTSYDPRLNSVIVTTLATLSQAEEALIRQVSTNDGVTVQRVDLASLFGGLRLCGVFNCDPPLRGGRFIRGDNGTFLIGCTGGFTARHRVNKNDLLIFTAGHCLHFLGLSGVWRTRNEASEWNPIGTGYGFVFAGQTGMDAGVVHVNPTMSWASPAPLPQVVVKGSSMTTYNPNYKIKHDSASSMGQLLCVTGGMTNTHCAEVSGLGADFASTDGFLLKNLGELDWCGSVDGDSGSPIYKNGRAFGLLVGSIKSQPFQCLTGYQGIRAAQNALNVDLLLSP